MIWIKEVALEDYFAGMVAQGICQQIFENYSPEWIAGYSYDVADALVEERTARRLEREAKAEIDKAVQ